MGNKMLKILVIARTEIIFSNHSNAASVLCGSMKTHSDCCCFCVKKDMFMYAYQLYYGIIITDNDQNILTYF